MFQFSIQFPSKPRKNPARVDQEKRILESGWFGAFVVVSLLLCVGYKLQLIPDKIFASGLGVSLGGLFMYLGSYLYLNDLRVIRAARNTPTSKIRSAAQGYVELNGTLIQRENTPLLQSPLTATPCLWWSYDIQKKTSTGVGVGKGYHQAAWISIDSGESEGWLHLEDGTGQCAINPAGASITGHQSKSWRGNTPHPRDPPITGLRKLSAGGYLYSESVLLPDQPLYAIGEFRTHDGQHTLEAPHDQRPFALSGKGEAAVLRSARERVIIGGISFLLGAIGLAGGVGWLFLG